MSFDLAVWYSPAAITEQQASSYLQGVGRNVVIVKREPEFDAFFTELLIKYPNLGGWGHELEHALDLSPFLLKTVDGDDEWVPQPRPSNWRELMSKDEPNTPWAATLSIEGSFVQLPIVWSRAEETYPVVKEMALRHGLVVYDPQDGELAQPPSLPHVNMHEPTLSMSLSGRRPHINADIKLNGAEVLQHVFPSRQAAHERAKEIALERGLDSYSVTDPQSVAQAPPTELSPDDPALAPLKPMIEERLNRGEKVRVFRNAAGIIEIRGDDSTLYTVHAKQSPRP